MTRMTARALLTAACLVLASGWTFAQVPDNLKAPPRPAQAQVPVYQDNPNAPETRQRLQELLRQYPPSVSEVLRADPTLLTRADYLAPYPALVAFLQQHPEIVRNPSYFLGRFEYYERLPNDRSFELLQMMLAGIGLTMLGSALIGVLIWLVRTAIDHRRWLRLTRTQTEVHTKLLDRLSTNEELMAYIQSTAGRRFLESAPVNVELESRTPNAPVSRILWSLQAGLVLGSLGLGFWLVQTRVEAQLAEAFWIMGALIAALGFGFVASAIVAYVISARMGLVHRPKTEQEA
ncbi:MAG TPA: hypothetical protein VKB50_27015 [Vicinamibacterales bacterium]|nr:hypothetical protein [Vicinamibacterales bacterium]